MKIFLSVFFCMFLASHKRIRKHCDLKVPVPFGRHNGMIFVPSMKYKNIDKDERLDALGWVESLALFALELNMLETYKTSGYEVLKDEEWFSGPYKALKDKIISFISDVAMEEFKKNQLTISDLVIKVANKIEDKDYFPLFLEEIKMVWKKKKAQRLFVENKVYRAYKTYTSLLSEKERKEQVEKTEWMCKFYTKVFSGMRGVKLMIGMFSRTKKAAFDTGMLYARATGDIIKSNEECFFMTLKLYDKYGLSVAVEAYRYSLLYPEKSSEEILKFPKVVSSIEKKMREVEKNGQKLVREEELRKARSRDTKGTARPTKQCGRREEEVVAESEQDLEEEEIVEYYGGDEKEEIKSRYRCTWRVSRWRKTPQKIKEYFDTHGPKKYRGQDIEKIVFQKERHDIELVMRVLEKDDADEYFFDTTKGKSALADFEIGGDRKRGILEIGIDTEHNVIYHIMFNQFNPQTQEISRVISPAFPVEAVNSDSECDSAPFRCPAGSMITKTGHCYVVKYVSHEDDSVVHKALYLHSYWLR